MPQWDFLKFLSKHGQRYAGFRLMMKTEATELLERGGQVIGLRAISEHGPTEVRADLVPHVARSFALAWSARERGQELG